MFKTSLYGKIIREYEGNGQIVLPNGLLSECSIQAAQLSDGRIVAECSFDENLDVARKCWSEQIESIRAISKEGDVIEFNGQIICTNFNEKATSSGNEIVMLVMVAGSVTVKKTTRRKISTARFGITNFEFLGNEGSAYSGGGWGLNTLVMNLGGRTLEIHEVEDYAEKLKSISAQKGIDVTSEIVMCISLSELPDSTRSVVDAVCTLLSLARGTKINWVYCDYCDDSGQVVETFHKCSVNWPYSSLRLIDPRNLSDTVNFMEQVYGPYLAKKNGLRLDITIDGYLDAKRETAFLETRGLRAVVVLELLKGNYCAQQKALGNDVEFIISRPKFRGIKGTVELAMENGFKPTSQKEGPNEQPARLSAIETSQLTEMKLKVGDLNRRSFRTIVVDMLEGFGRPIDVGQLELFIKSRNSLVHRGSFLTNKPWQEYRMLIGVLDRILLQMLNYRGPFLDITAGFERKEWDQ